MLVLGSVKFGLPWVLSDVFPSNDWKSSPKRKTCDRMETNISRSGFWVHKEPGPLKTVSVYNPLHSLHYFRYVSRFLVFLQCFTSHPSSKKIAATEVIALLLQPRQLWWQNILNVQSLGARRSSRGRMVGSFFGDVHPRNLT